MSPTPPTTPAPAPVSTPQLNLLRAKLALAIGPLDVNLAYHEVKATRPYALNEPWSPDMSEPHKYIGKYFLSPLPCGERIDSETDLGEIRAVFDNKAFTLTEVESAEVALGQVNRAPAIDAGEGVKLFCVCYSSSLSVSHPL